MIEQPKHDARERENPDPHEKNRPVPRLVLAVVSALVIWAVGYIVLTQRNDAPELGDRRTLSTLEGKPAGAGGAADGAQVYAANCVACHQATGAGLPGVFPPLAGSEWVLAADQLPVNILLHGITGKLTVKDTAYNGQMPAFKDKLSDAEIAAVLSFVRSSFGNGAGKIGADIVKAERETGKDRKDPWNGDEDLNKLKQ
ncbi:MULTISPECIES: cytochrome c [unclassified Duganella]|uniref:c-type cytochrome n=1 Tax=unclassified Duganella TaxID=2636909 RepID=UPI000E341360|nr:MULTISPECIES: cytochrome c [unclassified Duganella]RFP19402.1 cytochrome c [Duganella sp. BJB475]RFP35983.1 cytochrome c [Duganella sp. BJB476]